MQVFDELHRVLRDDGALVVNLGDTYSCKPVGKFKPGAALAGRALDGHVESGGFDKTGAGIQEKSLCLIPNRFSIAMLDHGWICRNVVVWKKKSAMPTSARDRMRCSWEPCFVFVKRGKYYSDAEAVRVAAGTTSGWAKQRSKGDDTWQYNNTPERIAATGQRVDSSTLGDAGANPGDVLTLGPQPSKIEHYAMYPVRLPLWFMRWLMPRKVCAECGMAWGRVVELVGGRTTGRTPERQAMADKVGKPNGTAYGSGLAMEDIAKHTTLRWQPQCECGAEATGPTILDPYGGPGTTAAAAEWLWTDPAQAFDDNGANAKCEWLPGKAIMLDLDPNVEKLYPRRRDECYCSLMDKSASLAIGAPTMPLFAENA